MPGEYNIGEEPNMLKPTVPPESRKNLLKWSTCKVEIQFFNRCKREWMMQLADIYIINRKNRDRSPGLNSQLGPQKEDDI